MLQDLVREYGIEGDHDVGTYGWNRTELSFTLWNGSFLFLYGTETQEKIERLRGDEFDFAAIDEAKSFTPLNLQYLLDEVLMQAVATRGGIVWMVGTPGHIFDGEFYLATNPGKVRKDERGADTSIVVGRWYSPDNGVMHDVMWSTHRWTMADNLAKPEQWQRALDDKARKQWRDDHPSWRREYLGEWVVNEDGLVYALGYLLHVDPVRVLWEPDVARSDSHGLPAGEWHYLLGIDFGFENPTAFVVAAYCRNPQELRVLHSEKHQHLVLSDVADVYKHLARRFGGFEAIVVDAGAQGKMIQETLASDYGIPAIGADKREKNAYIQAMNSDYHSGRIKVIAGDGYTEEARALSWDLSNGSKEVLGRRGLLREDPEMPNDLCDAFLYLWRYSSHRWEDKPGDEGPKYGTVEWQLKRERDSFDRAVAERTRQREDDENLFDGVKEIVRGFFRRS